MNAPINPNYSTAQVRTRISVYVAIGALTAASSQVLNLVTMTDAQLAAITNLRWALLGLLFVITIASAGLNAFRAAIDRSTAGGNDATNLPAPAGDAPANTASPAMVMRTILLFTVLLFGCAGCADIGSVGVTSSYTDPDGDTFSAGVNIGLLHPTPSPSPTPTAAAPASK